MAALSGNEMWRHRCRWQICHVATSIPMVSPARLLSILVRARFFLNALTTPDGGATKKHLIFSLDLDTGAINPGWPVDVNASATYNGITFTSTVQGERGALGIVGDILYVPYGGRAGDCGTYRGWLVGVPINNPASVTAWAASAIGGGAW